MTSRAQATFGLCLLILAVSCGMASGNSNGSDVVSDVATGSRDAVVRLQTDHNDDPAGTATELIIQSTVVNESESLLMNVYYVSLPQGLGEAQSTDTLSDHERHLAGTVAFFPPPQMNEKRLFVVDGPADFGQQWHVVVELVSARPGRTIVDSSVRVISASTVAGQPSE